MNAFHSAEIPCRPLHPLHYCLTTLPMRISAKNLGILALPDCCPRCSWMRAKLGWKSPWAIMPGIFSSIDGFSKRAILAFFEKNGHFPPWIAGRWSDARPLPTPHHSTFRLTDPETGVILTGIPDLVLGLPNRRLAILDLKTARYSKHQDALLPMYKTQLNGYALIAESLGMGTVEALGLVYGEPPANDDSKGLNALVSDVGFSMPFKATALPIELDRTLIPPLLKKAKTILEMDKAPDGQEGCKECQMVEEMIGICGKV